MKPSCTMQSGVESMGQTKPHNKNIVALALKAAARVGIGKKLKLGLKK